MKGLLDFTSGTSVYEVFKRICQQRGEGVALQAVAQMQQGHVVELTSALALSAASLSMKEHLPMADSVILATARLFAQSCGRRIKISKVCKASDTFQKREEQPRPATRSKGGAADFHLLRSTERLGHSTSDQVALSLRNHRRQRWFAASIGSTKSPRCKKSKKHTRR